MGALRRDFFTRLRRPYRYHDDLGGGEPRREGYPFIVAVYHDQRTDKSSRNTPGGSVDEFTHIVPVQELYAKSLGEVLTKKMRGTCLERLAILHHRLDGVSVYRTRKAFTGSFLPCPDRHGHFALGEFSIDIQHPPGLLSCLHFVGVGGMAFLPQKFGRAQKGKSSLFPTKDIGPLIEQQRQVAVTLYPSAVHVPNHGFGCRA